MGEGTGSRQLVAEEGRETELVDRGAGAEWGGTCHLCPCCLCQSWEGQEGAGGVAGQGWLL